MMTHQLGVAIRVGIDLHLGQKPKLGGRYADDSLIYISYFVGSLYIHFSLSFYLVASCFYFCFPKHKKTKNISVVSLFLLLKFATFGLLYLLFSVCYLKTQKYFALFAILSVFVSKIKNPKNICVLFRFCKVIAEFSLPLLHWSLVFTLYYLSHTSEEQLMTTHDNPSCGERLV
jgi:hypothetical protein